MKRDLFHINSYFKHSSGDQQMNQQVSLKKEVESAT